MERNLETECKVLLNSEDYETLKREAKKIKQV